MVSDEALTTPHLKNVSYVLQNRKEEPRTWTDTLVQPEQRKMEVRFGAWNVRSMYRAGFLTAAARELASYKLRLVVCRRVGGTKRAG